MSKKIIEDDEYIYFRVPENLSHQILKDLENINHGRKLKKYDIRDYLISEEEIHNISGFYEKFGKDMIKYFEEKMKEKEKYIKNPKEWNHKAITRKKNKTEDSL